MHAIRAASAAVLGLTALTVTAPAATAAPAGDSHQRFQVSASPTTVAAGGQVSLHVSGCSGETEVWAGIFDKVTIPSGGTVSRKVDWDAKQGAVYTVRFRCDGDEKSVDLTVAGGRPETPTAPPVQYGVRAGVGGSIGGFDVKEIGLGAALIAGALGGAYYLSRRRTGDDNG